MSRPKVIDEPSPWNMRIWDVENNEWLGEGDPDGATFYGFDIRGGETTVFSNMDWLYNQFAHGREFVWERSTGLKDKNGKEIYEGDTVKWLNGLGEYTEFRVEWQENRARFCLRNEYSVYDYEDLNDKKEPYVEVIGNIHEKPDLLMSEIGPWRIYDKTSRYRTK